jgi:hopene-associated glycosyltransferase HpnB
VIAGGHAHFVAFIASCGAAVWAYLFFGRGAFWRPRKFDGDANDIPLPARLPRIQVIIPARNEAKAIGVTISALLQQEYPGELRIAVVDDHSSDSTAEVARAAAASSRREERITILSAPPLDPGWTGKLWALQHGVRTAPLAAEAANLAANEPRAARVGSTVPDFYWFSDADIEHAPDTLRRLIARAERDRLDLVSLMVLLRSRTFPEKALIPPFLYFFLQLYPPLWIADTRSRTAGAAGGCLLIRRECLERIGGLAAIRDAVIDDCALARAVKSSGGRIWMGITRASVSLRDYHHFAEIRDMIARTAFTQLRYSPGVLFFAFAGLLLTYIAPVLLVIAGRGWPRALGALAWLMMSLTFLPIVRYYRLSLAWAVSLPAAAVFYTYATLLSAVRFWLGRGGQWKGRTQAPYSTHTNA